MAVLALKIDGVEGRFVGCRFDTGAQQQALIGEFARNGQLGIMDYYKMKNIVADTKMRDNIGAKDSEPEGETE